VCGSVEIEISPEPTEEERAAILAALAPERDAAAPVPWRPEEEDQPLP
jgi:hypothetical protein